MNQTDISQLESVDVGGDKLFCMPPTPVAFDHLKWMPIHDTIMDLVRPHDNLRPLPILAEGPPGSGKTSSAALVAHRLGVPLYAQPAHDGLDAADMTSYIRPGVDGSLSVVLTPLSTAWLRGGIALVDDVDKARPGALSTLIPYLDSLASVTIESAAVALPRNERFTLLLTCNAAHGLDRWLTDRCFRLRVPHPGIDVSLALAVTSLEEDRMQHYLYNAWEEEWKTKWGGDLAPREARLILTAALRREPTVGVKTAVHEAFASLAPAVGEEVEHGHA